MTTHPPSDTPRTDGFVGRLRPIEVGGDFVVTGHMVRDAFVAWATFARTLERELAQAREEIKRLNEWVDGFTDRHLEERRTGDALVKECLQRAEHAESLLATTRADALEEAAKEADAYVSDGNQYAGHAGRAVARRIRALPAAPAPKKEDGNG